MEIKHDKVDAVIVGAGAGGGIVAKQLAVAGFKCVLLERGQWPDYDDSPNDELINQRTHAIRPLHFMDRRKFVDPEKPWITDSFLNAACVGSGTVTYGAMAWRFMPQDFKLHTLYPDIKDSALADWPITYDDLEPFYEQAEYEIGVSGDQSQNPFAPPRKKDFPMPAFEYNKEDREVLIPAIKRMGFHPYPIPMLRNSVRYNGRAACLRNHTCCGYICPCDAKNGTQNTVIPVAIKSGNCEVRTGSIAYEIVMEGRRAVGVRYFDIDQNSHFQPASIVVSSAGSSGTTKLLLMSKSKMFPDGLGNNSDMVGRCANSHHYTGAFGLFDRDVSAEQGPGATVAFSDLNHIPDKKIFAGVLCSEFYSLPWAKTQIRPPNSPMWGAEHKKFQRENYRRILRIIGPVQEIPMYEARIVLHKTKKDAFGMPMLATQGGKHPLTVKQSNIMSDTAKAVLEEAGAIQTWKINSDPGLGWCNAGGQHQACSCRMGDNPKYSVVDPNCKIWGTENVFIGDAAVHVNNGGFNPVLTIMALAFRTGAHIAKTFSKA